MLSIVITHNGLTNNWINTCLNSLINSTYPTDILVIDNASTDDTIKHIKHNFTTIDLICSPVNLGFGAANNLGIKKCLSQQYDFAFLLNQDASVQPRTLERMIGLASKNIVYGVLSPIHLNGNGSALDYNFSGYMSPPNCKMLYSDVLLRHEKDIYECNFVNAAAWLIPKTCLEIVGGFSPSFFHYGEDDNFCHRVKWHDFKIGIITNCYIHHDRQASEKKNSDNMQWERMLASIKVIFSNPYQTKSRLFLIGHLLKYGIKYPTFLMNSLKTISTFPYNSFFKNRRKSRSAGAFLSKADCA